MTGNRQYILLMQIYIVEYMLHYTPAQWTVVVLNPIGDAWFDFMVM